MQYSGNDYNNKSGVCCQEVPSCRSGGTTTNAISHQAYRLISTKWGVDPDVIICFMSVPKLKYPRGRGPMKSFGFPIASVDVQGTAPTPSCWLARVLTSRRRSRSRWSRSSERLADIRSPKDPEAHHSPVQAHLCSCRSGSPKAQHQFAHICGHH